MHITDHTPQRRPSILANVLRWFSRADASHRARHHVANLDDQSLRDVGLTRDKANAAFRRRFAEHRYHPRRYL